MVLKNFKPIVLHVFIVSHIFLSYSASATVFRKAKNEISDASSAEVLDTFPSGRSGSRGSHVIKRPPASLDACRRHGYQSISVSHVYSKLATWSHTRTEGYVSDGACIIICRVQQGCSLMYLICFCRILAWAMFQQQNAFCLASCR